MCCILYFKKDKIQFSLKWEKIVHFRGSFDGLVSVCGRRKVYGGLNLKKLESPMKQFVDNKDL